MTEDGGGRDTLGGSAGDWAGRGAVLEEFMRRGGVSLVSSVHTGDASPGFSKEIAAALAGVPGFEVSAAGLGLGLGLEEELRMEPLGLEGLSMLSDPCALLPDPAVEDSFRSDRLQ